MNSWQDLKNKSNIPLSEVRSQKSEVRSQKLEVRSQKSEVRIFFRWLSQV